MSNPFQLNGGAVVAMRGKNCVAIASDKRFGSQFQTLSMDHAKLHRVTDKVVLGVAGLGTDTMTVHEQLVFRTNLYRLREDRNPTPATTAHILSNMLYSRRFGPWFVDPIVAGLDGDNRPFVTGMDSLGCWEPSEDLEYACAGTSSEGMLGLCESFYKPDQEPEDLVETVCQLFLAGLDRDCLSGWGARVLLITPDKVIQREIKGRMD